MMKTVKLLLFFICGLICFDALASEYAVGDHLSVITLADQFGKPLGVNQQTRWIVFTRSMDGADVAKAALETMTSDQLARHNIVYVADVSSMPSLILKFAALPKMQQQSYAIAIDKEGDATKLYPVAKGTAALLGVNQMQLTEIRYFDDSEALKNSLNELMK